MVDAANPDTPGAANRVLEILRAMMFRTKEWGWRKLDTNPCLGIRKNPRRKIARFLDAEELQRLGRADRFLFPRYAQGRGLDRLVKCWRTVCDEAQLGRLRLHDLRHTLASQAVMSGENLPLVGQLLGHRRHRTTAGYAHLADRHLFEAVERVGKAIAEALGSSGDSH